MRDGNVFNKLRGLPRMSWSPENLYNLWNRSLGPLAQETKFTRSPLTLFQQRWRSKRLVRGYHGDWIGETKFKRWYLPERLPDVRTRKDANKDVTGLAKWANRSKDAQAELRKAENEVEKARAPVGSLMFSEVERRMDVFLFRCCFATSAYQARQLIVHGKVTLNGEKHINPNTRLNPGDLVSVDPKAMPLLNAKPPKAVEAAPAESSATEPATPETDEAASTSADGASSETTSTPTTENPTENATPARAPLAKHQNQLTLPQYASPFLFIPAYIEVSFPTCSAIYLRHPTARPGYSEIPTPYDADGEVMRFAWEWYQKVRPRMRGRRERWTSPEKATN